MTYVPAAGFDSALVSVMKSVLEEAADEISTAEPSVKARMAERILKTAAKGVTKAESLKSAALDEGSKSHTLS